MRAGRVPAERRDAGGRPLDREQAGDPPERLELADTLDDHEDIERRGAALLGDRRRIVGLALAVILLIVAIYVVVPKVTGLQHSNPVARLGHATWYWLIVALGFNVLRFFAYTILFRGVIAGEEDDTVARRL